MRSAITSTYDIVRKQTGTTTGSTAAIRYSRVGSVPSRSDILIRRSGKSVSTFASYRFWTPGIVANRFAVLHPFGDRASGEHDRIRFVESGGTWPGRFDHIANLVGSAPGRFHVVFSYDDLPLRKSGLAGCRWSVISGIRAKETGRYDVSPPLPHGRHSGRFAAIRSQAAAACFDRRAFVRPGWRLLVKNLLTDAVSELGFIDVDSGERELRGVSLPDGEYELIVLTSSLFWQDARDRVLRRFSVRPGSIDPLIPIIENLRASVSGGGTTIRWSAEFYKDVVFGLWFSPLTPVDISGPPDAVSIALDGITEYSYSRNQTGPEYVAVAAIRDEIQGPMAELYLDWSSVPPRAPDDVVVLHEPLPVFDADVLGRVVEEEDLALVF